MEKLRIDLSQPQEELKKTTGEVDDLRKELKGLDGMQIDIDVNADVEKAERLAENMGHATRVAAGLAGGVEVVQGALHLMGVESETAEKAIGNMMAVMEIANGFSAIADGVESFVKLSKAVKASTWFSKLFNIEKRKETAVVTANTVAQKANAMAIKASTAATKGLKAALVSSGVGAIIVGLGIALEGLMSATEGANDEISKLSENKSLDEFKDNLFSLSNDIKNSVDEMTRYMSENTISEVIDKENIKLKQSLKVMIENLQESVTALSRGKNGYDTEIVSLVEYLKTLNKGEFATLDDVVNNMLRIDPSNLAESKQLFTGYMDDINGWIETNLDRTISQFSRLSAAAPGRSEEGKKKILNTEAINNVREDLQGGMKTLLESYTDFIKTINDLDNKGRQKIDSILSEISFYGLTKYQESLKKIKDKREEALRAFENTTSDTEEERTKIMAYYNQLERDLYRETEAEAKLLFSTSDSITLEIDTLTRTHNENLKKLKDFFNDRIISKKFYEDNKAILEEIYEDQKSTLEYRRNIVSTEKELLQAELELSIFEATGDKNDEVELKRLEKQKWMAAEKLRILNEYQSNIDKFIKQKKAGVFNIYTNDILDVEKTEAEQDKFLQLIVNTRDSQLNTMVKRFEESNKEVVNAVDEADKDLVGELQRKRALLAQSFRAGEDGIESLYASGNFVAAAEKNRDMIAADIELLEQYRGKIDDIDIEITEAQIALTNAEKEVMQAKIDAMNVMMDTFNTAAASIIASGDAISQEWNNVFSTLQTGLNQIGESLKTNGKGWQAYTQVVGSAFNVLGSTFSAIASEQNENTKEGFEKQKKFETAAAVMNTLGGIINVITSVWNPVNAWLTPWGQAALSASMSSALAVMGGIQIKKIKNTKFDGGEGDVAPSLNAMSAMAPSVNVASLVEGASVEGETKDTRVYVSETDITNTQKRVNVAETESRY